MTARRSRCWSQLPCEEPPKKKRAVDILVDSDLSVRQLEKVLNKLDFEGDCDRKRIAKEIDAELNHHTPAGPLLMQTQIPLEDNSTYTWHHVNPMAFLYHLCTLSGAQSDLLRSCTATGPANLVLYHDESSTGNVLHPDHPREMVNFYWSFKELPPWYKSRKLGWYAYGFLPSKIVAEACGGLSSICGRVVKNFFGGQRSLTGGIMLPGRDDKFAFKAVMGFFVMDEKAHKVMWSVKGASGAKCCFNCKNIIRCEASKVQGHAYLRHVSCHNPGEWDQHTAKSFLEMADKLQLCAVMRPKELEREETTLGLKYDPLALPWNLEVREWCNPITCGYWDAYHVFLCSGGLAQFHLNAFILELEAHSVDAWTLDDFQKHIVWPKSLQHDFPKEFFNSRTVRSADAHIKAFAKETLCAVYVVVMFIKLILQKREPPVMVEHCRCFLMLGEILSIFELGDRAVQRVHKLRRVVSEHQELYKTLYGIKLGSKPRNHYAFHVVDQLSVFQMLAHTCAQERQHKIVNNKSRNCTGPKNHAAILKRFLLEQFKKLVVEFGHPGVLH